MTVTRAWFLAAALKRVTPPDTKEIIKKQLEKLFVQQKSVLHNARKSKPRG